MTGPKYRVLTVMAHPDDLEFGCAGTIAKWADEGAEVTSCVVTDGSTGTQDATLVGEPLAKIRRAETERAAAILGAKEVVWLEYEDGYVTYSLDLRRDVARVFRKFRPHRFMLMDPTPTIEDRFINHPDHRAVGLASLDVTLSAGTTPGHFPELLTEGLEPWRGLREVWIVGPGDKPVVVDISATIDRKIEALLAHESQVGDNAGEIASWIRDSAALLGKPAGHDYGESFQVISQGPGFHAGEEDDDVDFGEIAYDPRSNPVRGNDPDST